MIDQEFIAQKDELLNIAYAVLEAEGATREANIINSFESQLLYHDFQFDGRNHYSLVIKVPYPEYRNLKSYQRKIERKLLDTVTPFLIDNQQNISLVHLMPTMDKVETEEKNQDVDQSTTPINNQGRVRSDNPATIEEDGLYFRSFPEVQLYKALKSLGFLFAPLPVFLKGGRTYKRYEPDFFIISEGHMVIVEVDGEEAHVHRTSEDNRRSLMFEQDGVKVMRVRASDCFTKAGAMRVAVSIIEKMNEYKGSVSI